MPSHQQLVDRAAKWLKNTVGCQIVLARPNIVTAEVPDAIGWKASGVSYLVECKASRGDFLRDKEKFFRVHPTLGVGTYRYYLLPSGMVKAVEVPSGWGLLEYHWHKTRVVLEAPAHVERNVRVELQLALAYARNPSAGVPAVELDQEVDEYAI